jgi:hypothetical protein
MFYSKTVKEDKDDFIVSDPAPEFKEATAPKDGEGKKNTDKGGQLFTDLTTNENTQSGGATGTAQKQQDEEADTSDESGESKSECSNEDDDAELIITRLGHTVRLPSRFRESSAANFDMKLSPAEQRFLQGMKH